MMLSDKEWIAQRAVFTTRHDRFQKHNAGMREMIPGLPRAHLSAHLIDEVEVSRLKYPDELPNSIAGTASFSDHTLVLRKRYDVMLLHNLQPKNGNVNGS